MDRLDVSSVVCLHASDLFIEVISWTEPDFDVIKVVGGKEVDTVIHLDSRVSRLLFPRQSGRRVAIRIGVFLVIGIV